VLDPIPFQPQSIPTLTMYERTPAGPVLRGPYPDLFWTWSGADPQFWFTYNSTDGITFTFLASVLGTVRNYNLPVGSSGYYYITGFPQPTRDSNTVFLPAPVDEAISESEISSMPGLAAMSVVVAIDVRVTDAGDTRVTDGGDTRILG